MLEFGACTITIRCLELLLLLLLLLLPLVFWDRVSPQLSWNFGLKLGDPPAFLKKVGRGRFREMDQAQGATRANVGKEGPQDAQKAEGLEYRTLLPPPVEVSTLTNPPLSPPLAQPDSWA